MKRVLSKFGAMSHLATLSEDRSVKAADRAKLTGYCKKWVNAKYILGCALFVDLLTPCTPRSFNLSPKNSKETEKLSSKPLDQWPTYAATIRNCTEKDGNKTYQCHEPKQFSEAVRLYSSQYEDYCSKVS